MYVTTSRCWPAELPNSTSLYVHKTHNQNHDNVITYSYITLVKELSITIYVAIYIDMQLTGYIVCMHVSTLGPGPLCQHNFKHNRSLKALSIMLA